MPAHLIQTLRCREGPGDFYAEIAIFFGGRKGSDFIAVDWDESARQALEAVAAETSKGVVVFDCGELAKINSVGIKNWINFFDRFDDRVESRYARCPMAFVDVAMMVPSFAKQRLISSFYSCFHCETCQLEQPVLIELDRGVGSAPSCPPCERCGQRMELDDDIDADLDFMRARA